MDRNPNSRIWKALAAVVVAITVGTLGFWLLEEGKVPIGDCLYMTIITLSTVGYGEVIPMTAATRAFACFLILFGMGTLIYFGSTVVAFVLELDIQHVRRRRRMQEKIKNLKNHVIVCGVGTTGARVVRELLAANTPFVMIENRLERIEELRQNLEIEEDELRAPFIHGDSTEDYILREAGIERASGLVAALPNDKDNLYIILSARQLNPKIRIVARATEKDAPPKMIHAGADRVVSPNLIGGMRIASELLRPQVVEFLDQMLRDQTQSTRIEQVFVPKESRLVGKRLIETNIRKATDVLVIAVRNKDGEYTYNPGPETVLTEESVLIVLGTLEATAKLARSVAGKTHSLPLITEERPGGEGGAHV